jgi:hypothetical protein
VKRTLCGATAGNSKQFFQFITREYIYKIVIIGKLNIYANRGHFKDKTRAEIGIGLGPAINNHSDQWIIKTAERF